MSLHSRISFSVSPLLWLAPLPFAIALCLPAPPHPATPLAADRVAVASVQTLAQAASAPAAR